MSTLSDSSIHEADNDIFGDYENTSVREHDNQNDSDRDEREGLDNGDEINTARRIDPSKSQKHVVRNPVPRLNAERIKGPKGIQVIEKHFEGFKFHGKGHEKTDLDRVMKRLEHWAHRLFPKLDFDDFLNTAERLGNKREVQVFVKKYRLDMIQDDVTVTEDIHDDEDNAESAPTDEFDILIAEQIEKQKQVILANPITADATSSNIDRINSVANVLESTVDLFNATPVIRNTTTNVPVTEFSDEIKERIERNRQQAVQRRLARLKALEMESHKKETDKTNITSAGLSTQIYASQEVSNIQYEENLPDNSLDTKSQKRKSEEIDNTNTSENKKTNTSDDI